ncbi:MAG: polysaccharide deacetylase family protein [Phycisphaerales bacterium]|nr:polysaccharide deacetylase family protein [Phycisphaerales bacterium]
MILVSQVRMCGVLLTLLGPLGGCAAPAFRTKQIPATVNWTFDHGAPVRGDVTGKQLALVFTGGHYGEGTASILDTLRQHAAPAGFFLTGDYLAQPEYRALVPRMLREGHYVGPHSHAHLLYCAWEDRAKTLVEAADFRADLCRNIADLRACGALPAGEPIFFIPPYEWYNSDQVRWAKDAGIILFNFTPGSGSNRDWIPEDHPRFVTSAQILADILAYEHRDPHGLNGFLLLLHLGSQRADKLHPQLDPLLVELKQRGYEFVRVDRLLSAADGG